MSVVRTSGCLNKAAWRTWDRGVYPYSELRLLLGMLIPGFVCIYLRTHACPANYKQYSKHRNTENTCGTGIYRRDITSRSFFRVAAKVKRHSINTESINQSTNQSIHLTSSCVTVRRRMSRYTHRDTGANGGGKGNGNQARASMER